MTSDLLAGASWRCLACPPGAVADPARLPEDGWLAAHVPGTVAGVLRASGRDVEGLDPDAEDWWWRADLTVDPVPGEDYLLVADGLATVAEVWVGDRRVLTSTSMWLRHEVPVGVLRAGDRITVRFAALAPRLAERRPRPRWKASGISPQTLRWWRTSLLGRMAGISPVPPVVGPWRPLRLVPAAEQVGATWRAGVDGGAGVVDLTLRLPVAAAEATVTVGPVTVPVRRSGERTAVSVRVPDVRLWWPHTHGEPVRYDVAVTVDDRHWTLGRVGFRTVTADRTDGGFRLSVNGVPVFCRGAGWMPPDPVGLPPTGAAARATLVALRDAGMNMVRVGGATVYEDDGFFDLCDELGMLVWQDLMLARYDPPDDPEWLAALDAEIGQLADGAGRHASLAVVCGGMEVHQQAAMLGLDANRRAVPVLEEHAAATVERRLPGIPYLPSCPFGATLAFRPGSGVAHYFGVGAYRRPLTDARVAGVRFAAECLAFAIPPEGTAGGDEPAGGVRSGVPRDAGADWDFADVTEHYARELFGDASGPEVDRHRAACAAVFAATLTEWRRPGSGCDGALVIAARDLVPGAGWGILDAAGRPKAPWWTLRRVLQPVALLVVDEGLGGIAVHLVNDTAEPVAAVLRVETWSCDRLVEAGEQPMTAPARGAGTVDAEVVLGGFRDLTRAFRFGPAGFDCVSISATTGDGRLIGRHVHWPGDSTAGPTDLTAIAEMTEQGWIVTVTSDRAARWVSLEVPGWRAEDAWFDLPPATPYPVRLVPETAGGAPRANPPVGMVRAFNGLGPVAVEFRT